MLGLTQNFIIKYHNACFSGLQNYIGDIHNQAFEGEKHMPQVEVSQMMWIT